MTEWLALPIGRRTQPCLAEVKIFLNEQEVAIIAYWTSFPSVLGLLRDCKPYHQAGEDLMPR